MPKPDYNPLLTIEQLFDLVAPIAICGGADLLYMKKAIAAWKKICLLLPPVWTRHGCPDPWKELGPLAGWRLKNNEDFQNVYEGFALPAYNYLFAVIVSENGDQHWEQGHDYWGAKGFRRPGDTEKSFSISGDTFGCFPWYETAALLIAKVKQIESKTLNLI